MSYGVLVDDQVDAQGIFLITLGQRRHRRGSFDCPSSRPVKDLRPGGLDETQPGDCAIALNAKVEYGLLDFAAHGGPGPSLTDEDGDSIQVPTIGEVGVFDPDGGVLRVRP
jgi:hypothetical protein